MKRRPPDPAPPHPPGHGPAGKAEALRAAMRTVSASVFSRIVPATPISTRAKTYRCAIASHGPSNYSETFVRRHIERLFDGKTVIINVLDPTPAPSERPKFDIVKPGIVASLKLALFLRWWRVDCIVAEFGTIGLLIHRASTLSRIPMVCYFRGYDASKHLTDARYVARLRKIIPKLAGIVAVSDALLQNLRNKGVVHGNSHVIPSGVDTNVLVPGHKDSDLIVSVGRFVPKKAPQITLRAFAAAAERHPRIRLEMVGDGSELQECMRLAEKLGVADRIVFHGVLAYDKVTHILRTASIFLHHSVTDANGDAEGMPSALQEAMACGATIVTTRHSGIPEHISHNVNGLLVAEHDVAGYTAALESVLCDSDMRARLADAARQYSVQHLNYRTLQAEFERQIAKVVERA